MLIKEIEEKVLSGELILKSTLLGKKNRRKYIWDNKTDKILRVETKQYDNWLHKAMYKGTNRGYKISKKVYKKLLKELCK